MNDSFKKLVQLVSTPSNTRTASLLIILLIALAIPLTVMVSQQRQELRQRASVSDDGPGGCCVPGEPNDGQGNHCRDNEVCDIANGGCESGFSCRSTTGCGRDSDCGPGNRCQGGTCIPGNNTSQCQSAKSLEARFQLNDSDPWGESKQTAAGRAVNVAVFRNGSGQLAGSPVNNEYTPTDVSANITGQEINQPIDVSKINQFTPAQAGTYTLSASCGNNVTGTASLQVLGSVTPTPGGQPPGVPGAPTSTPVPPGCTDNCSQSSQICQGVTFNDACGHTCQGTKNCITPSPTPTNIPTSTPTRTPTPIPPTPTPGATQLVFNVKLTGIGTRPGENSSPRHRQIELKVQLFNNQNQQLPEKRGLIEYDSQSQTYKGTINIGNTLTTGNYLIKVRAEKYLWKQIPTMQFITGGTTFNVPNVTLVVGDINGDNVISGLDYNIYLSCFGSKAFSPTCGNNRDLADLNDDGKNDTDITSISTTNPYDKSDFKLLFDAFSKQRGD